MRFVRCLLSCITLFFLLGCADNITSTKIQYKRATTLSQIDDILSHFTQRPEDILVVFDFNYTLMYPLIPCLHKINIDTNKSEFKTIVGQLSHEQADKMLTGMMATQNQKLINEELPQFLKKHSKVNFLVCSSSLEKNADAYLSLLNKNNMKIINSYNLPNFEFLDFKEYLSGHPVYKNGVIVTNRNKKGEILLSFLRRIQRQPKLIIFIDNSVDKLEDVKAAIKSLKNINLIIVEYSEYKKKAVPKVSKEQFTKYWNKQVEEFLHNHM